MAYIPWQSRWSQREKDIRIDVETDIVQRLHERIPTERTDIRPEVVRIRLEEGHGTETDLQRVVSASSGLFFRRNDTLYERFPNVRGTAVDDRHMSEVRFFGHLECRDPGPITLNYSPDKLNPPGDVSTLRHIREHQIQFPVVAAVLYKVPGLAAVRLRLGRRIRVMEIAPYGERFCIALQFADRLLDAPRLIEFAGYHTDIGPQHATRINPKHQFRCPCRACRRHPTLYRSRLFGTHMSTEAPVIIIEVVPKHPCRQGTTPSQHRCCGSCLPVSRCGYANSGRLETPRLIPPGNIRTLSSVPQAYRADHLSL